MNIPTYHCCFKNYLLFALKKTVWNKDFNQIYHVWHPFLHGFMDLLIGNKFSFSQRTVNEWNRLSADCVGASSVNIFKNKIDIYLRRGGGILR